MNLQYGKRPDSARTAGRKSINMSFRTSAHTGVGISPVQRVAFQFTSHSKPVRRLVWESPSSLRPHPPKDGDCHTSDVGHWFAMTRIKRLHSQKHVIPNQFSFLVWESLVQQATLQNTCHSEPVRTLVWESPSYSRPHSQKTCHSEPVLFPGVGIPAEQRANIK